MWSSSSTCHPNDQNHPVSKAEPTTIWRKLISTAYIHNLIFFQSPPRARNHRLGWECRSASHLLLTPHQSICRSPAPLSPHSSTRGSGPSLTWNGHSALFRLRTVASNFEVLIFIPAISYLAELAVSNDVFCFCLSRWPLKPMWGLLFSLRHRLWFK